MSRQWSSYEARLLPRNRLGLSNWPIGKGACLVFDLKVRLVVIMADSLIRSLCAAFTAWIFCITTSPFLRMPQWFYYVWHITWPITSRKHTKFGLAAHAILFTINERPTVCGHFFHIHCQNVADRGNVNSSKLTLKESLHYDILPSVLVPSVSWNLNNKTTHRTTKCGLNSEVVIFWGILVCKDIIWDWLGGHIFEVVMWIKGVATR